MLQILDYSHQKDLPGLGCELLSGTHKEKGSSPFQADFGGSYTWGHPGSPELKDPDQGQVLTKDE